MGMNKLERLRGSPSMSTSSPEISDKFLVCPTCGRQLPAGANFCGFDGTVLNLQKLSSVDADLRGRQTQEATDIKICPDCFTVYPEFAMFCSVDAAKLVTALEFAQRRQTVSDVGLFDEETGDERVPITELIGKKIGGKYLLEEFIGEGGMAVVYKAMHINIEKPVVIKILQGRLTANTKSVQRFERESKVTAKISHPNVVSVFDVGFINHNQPYLVMEYIKGESLRDKLNRNGPVSIAIACQILIQILRGLKEAHDMGVIHRDLKPENILLQDQSDRPDWVKLVDFGIASLVSTDMQRLTKTGAVVGTAEYMAPEQLRDLKLDTRVDLYALGAILFEMLTLRVPFDAETTEALLLKILIDPPELPSKYREDIDAGSALDQVVAKALDKNPDLRYQTATEFRLEIEQILHQLQLNRGK